MNIVYLGNDVTVNFFKNATLSQILLSHVHRPKILNYEQVSFKNEQGVLIFTVANLCWGIWHFYTAYRSLKNMRY